MTPNGTYRKSLATDRPTCIILISLILKLTFYHRKLCTDGFLFAHIIGIFPAFRMCTINWLTPNGTYRTSLATDRPTFIVPIPVFFHIDNLIYVLVAGPEQFFSNWLFNTVFSSRTVIYLLIVYAILRAFRICIIKWLTQNGTYRKRLATDLPTCIIPISVILKLTFYHRKLCTDGFLFAHIIGNFTGS